MSGENMKKAYEPVIGLEVHVQLATRSKAFCGCSTKFGLPPNSATCPVCLGFPGSLPVLNRKAFECALKVGLALNCEVHKYVKFDRKNYYYPDLPKNYQISQYDKPVAVNGSLHLMSGRARPVMIRRVHLEEDAGKLLHDLDARQSAVDYNRAGTPLLEIVTEPDLFSPEEAYSYLTTLKSVLLYLEVSDCNMEEGSLRCDANVSIREAGASALGVKTELKNMNSFKSVRDGLSYEISRQMKALQDGEVIVQETRLWDPDAQVTRTMRTKEEAHDYRYFPEPDLVPFNISNGDIERVRRALPELPLSRRAGLMERFGFTEKEADLLVQDKKVADYFEEAMRSSVEPKTVYNWLTGDIMSELNMKKISIADYTVKPGMLSELIGLIGDGTISGKMAKDILRESAGTGKAPGDIVAKKGLRQIKDAGELSSVVDKVIAQNARSVNDYKGGKKNALMFLIGQVMKETKGKANPEIVNRLLTEKIG